MPFLQAGDVTLSYERLGEGSPVILIQGVGIAGQGWQPQVKALSKHYEVIVFDNRGVGKSSASSAPLSVEAMAADARAVMDYAGWPRAHVIGHSMGGIIAHQLALDTPERVLSLSLLCTCARGKDAAKLTLNTLWYGLRMNLGTLAMRRMASLALVTPAAVIAELGAETCAQMLESAFGRRLVDQPRYVFKQIGAMAKHDAMAQLPTLGSIPTLVVSAELDRVTLPRYGRQLAGLIPGARYVELEGCGHAVPVHQAVRINDLLLEHLAASKVGA